MHTCIFPLILKKKKIGNHAHSQSVNFLFDEKTHSTVGLWVGLQPSAPAVLLRHSHHRRYCFSLSLCCSHKYILSSYSLLSLVIPFPQVEQSC